MSEREAKFEAMLAFVLKQQADTEAKLAALKAQGREKSATFRQLLGDKLMYANMLNLYRLHGLVE